jgi:hypothetical protein
MRYISECVLSSLELAPPRIFAKVLRIAGPMFYEFDKKEKKAKVMTPDSDYVLRRLFNGTLLFKLDPLVGHLEALELNCVRKSRARLGKVSAFKFEHKYVSRNPSVFYSTTLPEFCYFDVSSVTMQRGMPNRILRNGNRQTIVWLSIEHEARREFHLGFNFYGPDKKGFKMRLSDVRRLPQRPKASDESLKVITDIINLAVDSQK